jgi:hypothetical protein
MLRYLKSTEFLVNKQRGSKQNNLHIAFAILVYNKYREKHAIILSIEFKHNELGLQYFNVIIFNCTTMKKFSYFSQFEI